VKLHQTFPLAIIGKEGEDISALLAGNQLISWPSKRRNKDETEERKLLKKLTPSNTPAAIPLKDCVITMPLLFDTKTKEL
jgi:pyruvate dehydrogenase E2 component (dihydrolipoamide acetyltransferase)